MNAKILMVDDDTFLLGMVKYALEAQGYQVHTVSTAFAAEEQAESTQPDLVLLDVLMPGISGLELCARLRQNHRLPPPLRIVMLSHVTDPATVAAAQQSGADAYIVKSTRLNDLVQQITQLLVDPSGVTPKS